jgi:hypothetical protein
MVSSWGIVGEEDVYDSLVHQAHSGDWTNGFLLRERSDDPWDFGIFESDRVHFEKGPEHHDKVTELRDLIFEVVRPFFIVEESWDELEEALTRLYTNPELCSFVEERRGNVFIITPHVQFHDLGIVAAASLSVRAKLDKDNPFAAPDDPGRDQTIVANRVLTLLDQEDFRLLTGLPILEGLMLPIADVVTTISANGSGRLARRMLGRDLTSTMNGLTRERLVQLTTRGSQIVILAPSGTQASRQQVDPYSDALVIGEASHGTKELMIELNQGEPITHRNAVAGLFIDCPSISPTGQIEPVNAGIGLCHDVWVPTEASQLELIMKATIRTGIGHGRRGGPEFRYGSADADPHLRKGQAAQLEKVKLAEIG